MRLLFDIEANGLLDTVTKVHCIGIIDVDTGEQRSFGPDRIEEALAVLYEADEVIGHNILGYDLPVLWKTHRWATRPGTRRTDTLVTARLIHADVAREDTKATVVINGVTVPFPSKYVGRHTLKAWGIRLGEHKGEYGVDQAGNPIPGCWDEWCPEMQEYMDQDCRTTLRLLQHLKPWDYPRVPLELEHRVQEVTLAITDAGWPFDVERAGKLYATLCQRRDELDTILIAKFGSWQEPEHDKNGPVTFVPKRDNKKRGYTKGVPIQRYKTVTFNPGSRVHIELKLREFGWKPTTFTPSGRAEVNEKELLKISIPEAKDLVEYLLIQKRLGQIGDGNNGWLKVVGSNGRIHGRYNPMGTNTGRAAHYGPNLGQVPKVSAPYGNECRACFTVPPGWKLIGADMAGAQLRCLAHMVAFYDKGAYAQVVLDGDIHWYHVKIIMGVDMDYDKHNALHAEWRNKAKTTIYAYLFGAQHKKIGSIWLPTGTRRAQVDEGDRIMTALDSKVTGLGNIKSTIKKKLDGRSSLKGLDGRLIPIRSAHSALNAVIQNYEAVLCKTWLVSVYDRMLDGGFTWGWDSSGGCAPSGNFVIVGWIHDELQIAVRDACDNVSLAKDIITQAARDSGAPYKFRVRLDSEATVGNNWSETH